VKTKKIALIGCGTVGGGVAEILLSRRANLDRRLAPLLELAAVVDLEVEALAGALGIPDGVRRETDYEKVLADPAVEIVAELIGGIHPALEIILGALKAGKDVVTANKALLAEHGDEIFRAARAAGRAVAFEASVGGGIPIVAALREAFVGNRIESLYGVVNGTCNYILTRMVEADLSYEAALAEAQAAGYAETPPTLDVEGFDTAHKLAVMARLAFGVRAPLAAIAREGIAGVSLEDIHYARQLGYTLKLLAVGREREDGLELRVGPALLRHTHPLAAIRGAFNAICVNGDAVGQAMLTGLGAGRMPTASAVVADLVSVALGTAGTVFGALSQFGEVPEANLLGPEQIVSRFYVHLLCADRPGVLAQVAGILSRHEISIASCIQQDEEDPSGFVPVVFMMHEAVEAKMRGALEEINALETVKAEGSRMLRVEDL
jgi:homoserine dehydrogenase